MMRRGFGEPASSSAHPVSPATGHWALPTASRLSPPGQCDGPITSLRITSQHRHGASHPEWFLRTRTFCHSAWPLPRCNRVCARFCLKHTLKLPGSGHARLSGAWWAKLGKTQMCPSHRTQSRALGAFRANLGVLQSSVTLPWEP